MSCTHLRAGLKGNRLYTGRLAPVRTHQLAPTPTLRGQLTRTSTPYPHLQKEAHTRWPIPVPPHPQDAANTHPDPHDMTNTHQLTPNLTIRTQLTHASSPPTP